MHSSFSEYNTRMNIQRHINVVATAQETRDKVFDEVGTTKQILHLPEDELPVGLHEFLKRESSPSTEPRTVLAWNINGVTYPRGQHIDLHVRGLTRSDKNNRRLYILCDFVRYYFQKLLNIDLYDYYGGNPAMLLDEKGIVREVESGPAIPIEGYTEKTIRVIMDVLFKRD